MRSNILFTRVLLAMVLLAVGLQSSIVRAEESESSESKYANDALKVAYAYADGGGYIWKDSTGVNETLEFDGKTILKKQPEGTYCCGFTFQVAFRLAEHRGLFEGKTYEQVKNFQREWYGSSKESAETQCTMAMEHLGVGHAVTHDEARPGDFGNFWRTKGGHSIIFLSWITDDDGNRIGLKYRSSQGSTDGIGDNTEYFDGHGGKVVPERIYLCRFNEPVKEEEEVRGKNR